MAEEPGAERSEAPTGKKRGEARKKGQVPKSPDLSQMTVLLGLIMILHSMLGAACLIVMNYFKLVYRHLDRIQLDERGVMLDGGQLLLTVARAVGPLAAGAMVIGVVVNVSQTGLLFATESLRLNFTKLNPLTGLKRLVSPNSVFTLGKSLYKIGLVGYIAYLTIRSSFPQLLVLSRLEPLQSIGIILDLVYRMALRIVVTMLVLSAVDYFYQRHTLEKSLKMTKDEVKQEMKQQESSPQLKARIRARQREIAKRRMMTEVPRADVVVANPTHFAVALKYDSSMMRAPTVVAKGQDLMAFKIRELAQQHDVPIVENPVLARALYHTTDLGREIPGELYEGVAEVLAFVYRINEQRRLRSGYAPAAR
jgi:flagellar biosynthetic protein FlhB